MLIIHEEIKVETVAGRPSYHDIDETLKALVETHRIAHGVLTLTTAHTTCSLFFDETMHDTNFYGDDYLHVDINNTMEKMVPRMTSENQYVSPGPKHVEFGMQLQHQDYVCEKWTMLNTDAHLRSSLFGTPSMNVIIKDHTLLLGTLGKVYFVDWDQTRARTRTLHVMIMGTQEANA